jgi:hypothetical protein
MYTTVVLKCSDSRVRSFEKKRKFKQLKEMSVKNC